MGPTISSGIQVLVVQRPQAAGYKRLKRGVLWVFLAQGFLAALLLCACSTQISQEKLGYRFRQSMIDPQWPPDNQIVAKDNRRTSASPLPKPAIARRCRHLVGQRFPGPHPEALLRVLRECLGREITTSALQDLAGDLYHHRPSPGDVILFHNTRDANQNHRLDDHYSDAGVVVGIEQQRVSFIFLRQQRVQLGVLNLKQPHRRRISHTIENTYLRVIRPDDPPRTQYLAGQLLAGFFARP